MKNFIPVISFVLALILTACGKEEPSPFLIQLTLPNALDAYPARRAQLAERIQRTQVVVKREAKEVQVIEFGQFVEFVVPDGIQVNDELCVQSWLQFGQQTFAMPALQGCKKITDSPRQYLKLSLNISSKYFD